MTRLQQQTANQKICAIIDTVEKMDQMFLGALYPRVTRIKCLIIREFAPEEFCDTVLSLYEDCLDEIGSNDPASSVLALNNVAVKLQNSPIEQEVV